MTKERNRIMGINPGTRYLGLAVFQDAELLDWRVKTFRGKWAKEKAGRILEMLSEHIKLYDINALAIKKLHPSRSSKNLKLLVSKIKALARRKRIKVKSFSIKELERVFLDGEKPNKRNLADRVVAEYPMLVHEYNKEKSQKHSYYMRSIEAMALGMKIKNAIDT
jgi:Holliday junction resolvasome RuvABC endonuclease subunit